MKKKLTTVEFKGTPEQEAKLLEVIARYEGVKGKMMPILQEAQDIYGYLPIEVMKIVAEKTGAPLEEIFGIATFYSQFKLNPNGEVSIAVCLGTACYVKGSQDILDEIVKILGVSAGHTTPDGMFTLEAARCLGCCGLAPVMMIDDQVYGRLVPADVKGIIDKVRAE